MKKALSLALALMMLMMMCITPVMAAEPDGSESNPYYVANPMTAPGFITVPANGAVYYQYNPAVFNGWSVEAYGLSAIVVDGVVHDQMNMWGGLEVEFTFNMMSPGIVGYVNDSDEEVQVMLTHGQPVGTIDNPAELTEGDNAFSIPATIMDYVSVFVPMANGDYTFSTEQAEDFQVTVFTNGSPAEGGTPNPVENGSLTLTLESYLPVYVVTTPVGMTGDITLTVTPPKAGTESNPIWMEADTFYTLEGTEPLYFQVDGGLAGNTLLIESFNGVDLSVTLDGVQHTAPGGALYLPLESDSWVMEMVISQADSAENTLFFSIQYAEGTEQNPIKLDLGDNKISIPEGGYNYYEYTVESNSLLTITPADAAAFGLLDAYSEADIAYAYLQEGASSVVLPVSAGATVLISASGVMNEETWVNGAVDTVLNIAVKDLILYSDFENGDADGWSTSSALTADDVDYISGWYSGKFEVTADWGNIYRYINVEANTDYEITFKAKAALNKGAWLKFNDNWGPDIAQADISLTTEWADYKFTLNSGDHTSAVLLLQYAGYAADGQVIWLDDFVITKAEKSDTPVDPSFDGYIYNGDFETGDLTNWNNLWNNNTVEFVEGMDSNFAISITTDKSWAQVRQDGIKVEANTDYVLTGWFKNNTNLGFCVKKGDDSGDIKSHLASETYGEWTKVSLEFNSGDQTEICVLLMSWENGGSAIIDNVTLAKAEKPVEPDEPIFSQLLVQFIGRLPSNDPKNGVFVSLSNDGENWTDPVVYSGHGMDMWGCSNTVNPTYLGTIDVTEQAKSLTSDKFYVKVGVAAGDITWTVLHQVRIAGTYTGDTEQTEFFWDDYSNLTAFNRTGNNAVDAAANVVNSVSHIVSANNVFLYSCPVDHTATGIAPYHPGYYGDPENVNGHVVYGVNIEPEQPSDKVYFEILGRLPGDGNGANKVQLMVGADGETWNEATLWEGPRDDHGDSTYAKIDITDAVDLSANNLFIKMNLAVYLDEWYSVRQIRVTHVSAEGTETVLMHVIYDDMAIGSEEYKSGLYVDSANVQLRGTYDATANDPSGLTVTADHDGQDGAALGDCYITYKIVLKEEPPVEVTYGDANGDGNINNRDLGMLQQYLNDYEVEISLDACDVNGDGNVNNRDLGLLQQYLNDWEVELG